MRKNEARVRVRLDDNVRCECGRRATQQVKFEQMRASGEPLTNWLPLCERCYAEMLEAEGARVQTLSMAPAAG